MEKLVGKTNEKESEARWKEDGSPVHRKEKISSYGRAVCPEDRAKADQILGEIEESCDRIGRLLKVFDRMG